MGANQTITVEGNIEEREKRADPESQLALAGGMGLRGYGEGVLAARARPRQAALRGGIIGYGSRTSAVSVNRSNDCNKSLVLSALRKDILASPGRRR